MKISELTCAALDYAVAKVMQDDTIGVYFNENGRPMRDMARHGYEFDSWEPSTNWAQGGPLIERECIELAAYDAETSQPKNPEYWEATIYQRNGPVRAEGTTPLVAAMRCYVASKMGEEINIPNEVSSI